MGVVNRVLGLANLRLTRARPASSERPVHPAAFVEQLSGLQSNPPDGFVVVIEQYREETLEHHPVDRIDHECAFVAEHIAHARPERVLDVGSYRHFIYGLLAGHQVTTVDVRDRQPMTSSETVVTSDAKSLDLPSDMFDAVVSLCALEHFGLGRYGDDVDLDADRKAVREMIRVLRPGGLLLLSTALTGGPPALWFNAHRVYGLDQIRAMLAGLVCQEERFFGRLLGRFCSLTELTTESTRTWDVYLGCWAKPV